MNCRHGMGMIEKTLIEILQATGKVSLPSENFQPTLDLYEHGLTSFNAVQVMIAIEEKFGIIFPDDLIRKETFASLSNLSAALSVEFP